MREKFRFIKRFKSVLTLSKPVEERTRFVISQLLRRSGQSSYVLRGSQTRVYLRHGTDDLATFHQVFQEDHYALPDRAVTLLKKKGDSLQMVDLGGNLGLFTAKLFSLFPAAEITVFEPDPKCLEVLYNFASHNGGGSISVIPACAATTDGETPFLIGRFGISRVPDQSELGEDNKEIVRKVDVFPYIQNADFVKIDIEGGEWEILQDTRFQSLGVPVVVLEYHKHLCPVESPEQLAREKLEEAGYIVFNEDFSAPEKHGVLWGLRE